MCEREPLLPLIVCFISDHGFGHAARICAALENLLCRRSHRVLLITKVPRFFLDEILLREEPLVVGCSPLFPELVVTCSPSATKLEDSLSLEQISTYRQRDQLLHSTEETGDRFHFAVEERKSTKSTKSYFLLPLRTDVGVRQKTSVQMDYKETLTFLSYHFDLYLPWIIPPLTNFLLSVGPRMVVGDSPALAPLVCSHFSPKTLPPTSRRVCLPPISLLPHQLEKPSPTFSLWLCDCRGTVGGSSATRKDDRMCTGG